VKRVGPGTKTVVYAYGVDGELAAEYDSEPSTVPGGVQYVAVDHLGSTRAVMDGAGAITRLEDFLPFGETIPAGIAGRGALYPATAWAEVAGTSKRFTGKEREGEVGAGLDYFLARYYSSAQGRFTSPDEFPGGAVDPFTGQQVGQPGPLPYADISNPQSLNKYAYVLNNPLCYVDPDGHTWAEFFEGMADTTYRPILQAVSHPLDTLGGIGQSVLHPISTAGAIADSVLATSRGVLAGDSKSLGEAAGTAVSALITTGAAKGVSALAKSARVAAVEDAVAISPRVQSIANQIEKGGFKVTPNSKTSNQIGNVTITHPGSSKQINLRVEIGPTPQGNRPHANVQVMRPNRKHPNKLREESNVHIYE
jgi:RHS repeat-associated protein